MQRAVKAEGRGQVVIGSFQGTKRENQTPQGYVEDFVSAARLVKETGAKVLEANYSCPNEGTNQLLCFDVDRVTRITTAIKNEIGNTPLLLKLAYFDDDWLLQRLIKSVGGMVEGLVAINTIPAQVQDRLGHPVLPGKSRESSGICGSFIYPYGLDMVRRLFQHREEMGLSYQIVGVGGVSTPEHYLKYREMGADSVMCATGAMYDPLLARRLKSEA
jgi:dihydroorotate dehydrogenase